MDNEDVVPQWLRTALLQFYPDWANAFPRLKFRVCRDCNGQMNSVFEIPARPIVLAMLSATPESPVTLGLSERCIVARWLMKTALLYAIVRKHRDDVSIGIHPQFAHGYDPVLALMNQRSWLLRLMRDGVATPSTSVAVAMIGDATRSRPVARRGDGAFVLNDMNLWLPLVTETVVQNGALRQHVAMRRIDDRFVVIWPPILGTVLWPPAPLAIDDLVEHVKMIAYKSTMPLIRVNRLRLPIAR
jgi:hypothetical protein